jgi:hypothetical protein
MSLRATFYPLLTLIASLVAIALMRRASLGSLTSVVAVALIASLALVFWRFQASDVLFVPIGEDSGRWRWATRNGRAKKL